MSSSNSGSYEDGLVRDCFHRGNQKATPLMEICCEQTCSPRYFQDFLDRHTNFEFLNRNDPELAVTPLMMLACQTNTPLHIRTALVKILLQAKYGVDVHVRAKLTGSAPVYGAAECGSTPIVALLLEHGADCLSRNVDPSTGKVVKPTTPLDIAVQNNHVELVSLLLHAASKQNKGDAIGKTTNAVHQSALQAAMLRQRIEMVGMMAYSSNFDMRRGFHVYWAANPEDEYKVDYTDPDPKYSKTHWALYKTVYSYTTKTCSHCRDGQKANVRCSRCQMAWYCNGDCQKKDWKCHKLCCKKLHAGMEMLQNLHEKNNATKSDEKPKLNLAGPTVKQAAGFNEPYDKSINKNLSPSRKTCTIEGNILFGNIRRESMVNKRGFDILP